MSITSQTNLLALNAAIVRVEFHLRINKKGLLQNRNIISILDSSLLYIMIFITMEVYNNDN